MNFNIEKAAAWLDSQTNSNTIFYASVDVRRGGGRICPIDVNLFPAGFNNLCKTDGGDVSARLNQAFDRIGVRRDAAIGVVAESHTRNPYYAEHLHSLIAFLRAAGYKTEVSCPECADDVVVASSSGQSLTLSPISRRGDKIVFGADFVPDILLLNNDLAAGAPLLLKNLSQPVIPGLGYGWFARRKHNFFETYAEIASNFCREIGVDPRTINPLTIHVGDVNFKEKSGLDRIAAAVEKVLAESKKWYEENGISETPTAIVKSDSGTYGMAVMSVTSADEILQMNRKTVNKMHVGKGKVQTTGVIVQEGIPTEDSVDGCPAEPAVYLIGGLPVGAFFRHHCERENTYNLNVSGMAFKPVCLHDLSPADPFMQVVIIAQLACAAAGREPLPK